jgi:hypothetical protein
MEIRTMDKAQKLSSNEQFAERALERVEWAKSFAPE